METELDQLEKNYEAAQMEIRELDLNAWQAISSLGHKDGSSGDFDPVRYKDLKRKLMDQLPIMESRLRKARIAHLQAQREELQKELAEIQPSQLKTKAVVMRAQELLEAAWQEHAKLDLKAAALENSLTLNFESTRHEQRELQNIIRDITGVVEDMGHDGLTKTENLLIRN